MSGLSGGRWAQDQEPVYTTYHEESRSHNAHHLYDAALNRIEHAIKEDPVNADKIAWRSNCHMKLFDAPAALADATHALTVVEEDTNPEQVYTHCLYRNAEALYNQGQFEQALVLYHQGAALRPNQKRFSLGVKKAKHAILNSLGELSKTHALDVTDSMPTLELFASQPQGDLETAAFHPPHYVVKSKALQSKRLLGTLVKDKCFVDDVNASPKYRDALNTELSQNGAELVGRFNDLSNFFDTREKFWRVQKPFYARQRERAMQNQRLERKLAHERLLKRDRLEKKRDNMKEYLQKALETMDKCYWSEDWQEIIDTGKEIVTYVQSKSNRVLLKKLEYLSVTYSYMTHAYMNFERYKETMQCGNRLLTAALETKKDAVIALAYATVGRTHARFGDFRSATANWESMIPWVQDNKRKAWLFHELSRCYFELNKVEMARMYARWALDAAVESKSGSSRRQSTSWEKRLRPRPSSISRPAPASRATSATSTRSSR